jgi:hypothetical protein
METAYARENSGFRSKFSFVGDFSFERMQEFGAGTGRGSNSERSS